MFISQDILKAKATFYFEPVKFFLQMFVLKANEVRQ